MSDIKRKVVHVLEDSPALEDAYGSHRRIADAIVDVVTTERGGKAIALIGSWGSGKSTVVKQIEKRALEIRHSVGANTQHELLIFPFDAWVHEGDPLRRSFLESLIGCFQSAGWIAKEKWNHKLEQLTQKRKQTNSTSSPVLRGIATFFLFLVYLAPLGLFLLANHEKFYHSRSISWTGFGLYILPAAALAIYVWCQRKKLGDAQDGYNLLALIANKTTERVDSETFEQPDPTSLEFQRIFREILSEALVASRRLLIVIDNLDRVDVHEALKMWSTIHTFVDLSSQRSASWTERFWTLVPFDETGITKLWRNETADQIGKTFLDKTFQIRFFVPNSVLSDWQSFMMGQLQKAFPGGEENEFYRISRIFGILNGTNSPTPREIKTFINQISSLYVSSPEVMSPPLIAMYVGLKAKGWSPETTLPQGLDVALQPFLEPDWLRRLAALHYNVPVDKAVQVLYGDRVEKCLVGGDAKGLVEIAMMPGIDLLIENILDQRLAQWSKNESVTLGRTAFALSEVTTPDTQTWRNIWARLSAAIMNVSAWPVLDAISGRGISFIIERGKNEGFSAKVLKAISSSPPPFPQTGSDDILRWTNGVMEVLKGIVVTGQEALARTSFSLGRTGTDYTRLLGASVPFNEDPRIIALLRPGCPNEDVTNALIESVRTAAFEPLMENGLARMIQTDFEWSWTQLIQEFQSRIQQPTTSAIEAAFFVRSLARIGRREPTAYQRLHESVQNGWIFHHLNSANQGNQFDSLSSLALVAILYDPEASGTSNPGSASQGRGVYRNLPSVLEGNSGLRDLLVSQSIELGIVGDLVTCVSKISLAKPIVVTILAGVAHAENAAWFFPPEKIVDHYGSLKDSIGPDLFQNLIRQSSRERDLIPEVIKRPFVIGRADVYCELLHISLSSQLAEFCAQGVAKATKDEWIGDINGNRAIIHLAESLRAMNVTVSLGHSLRDALGKTAEEAVAGVSRDHLDSTLTSQLFDLLSDAQQVNLRRHLRDIVIHASSTTLPLIRAFGPILNDCKTLREESEKIVRECFAKMLERRDPGELEWIGKTLLACPEIPKLCGQEALTDFNERVEYVGSQDLSDPVRTSVAGIRQSLQQYKVQ